MARNNSDPGRSAERSQSEPEAPSARTNERAFAGSDSVPHGMKIAGAWSWRILVLVGAIAVVIFIVMQLRLLVIPLFVAILIAALLVPFKNFLMRHKWPKWLSIAVAELSLIVVVGALIFLVITQVRAGYSDLRDQSVIAFDDLIVALGDSPLHLSQEQITEYIGLGFAQLQADSSALVAGALSVSSTVGHFLTGVLLALFATLFFLIDGKGIWSWIVRLFPTKARLAVDGAGQSGWITLQSFIKVQILVASIDAVGIGVGAAILGVPLAIPIAVLVFLGSFIPIVGAVLTGAIAVFIALVYNGWVVALIMLGIVLLVQQLEGHVLQPLIMGTAVKVHPLAVVLAVAGGSMIAGIAGALFAVPIVATLNVMIVYIAKGTWRHPEISPEQAAFDTSILTRTRKKES